MVERFAGANAPVLVPFALADAVAVLLRRGDDGEALAARMAVSELRIFVQTVSAHARRERPAAAWWDDLRRSLRALADDVVRQRVMAACEGLAARLDAERCLEVWSSALDEPSLLGGDVLGEALAVRLRLGHPDREPWPRHSTPFMAATLGCVRAVEGGGDRDELRRWLVSQLERGAEVGADVRGRLFTALALLDAEEAHRLYLTDLPWPGRGPITDAFGVLAPWIVRTKGESRLVDWILGMKYHVQASEWLGEACAARALPAALVEPVALELATRVETWLDPFSWYYSIAPLAQVAAEIGSVPVVEALCDRYLPPGERVADAMTAALGRRGAAEPAAAARFVDALAISAPFAESFDPPDDLRPAPWEAVPPAWIQVLEDPSAAELRAASFDALRLAAASPIPPAVWHPLGDVLARRR
jgi:hypothetical protein